jgi:alkylation response protein AidB-like acyl-CoA dehydrogenase
LTAAGVGMVVDRLTGMDEQTIPTVEMSLAALSDAVGKASDDLRAVRATLDVARADIASRNTSLSRDVVGHVEKVIVHLRETDESLRDVLKDLSQRD